MNTHSQLSLRYVDAKGLTCPMPLVLLKKAMADRLLGDCVRIDVTDIHAELDFEIWCERFGHKLVKTKVVGDTLTFEVTAGAV